MKNFLLLLILIVFSSSITYAQNISVEEKINKYDAETIQHAKKYTELIDMKKIFESTENSTRTQLNEQIKQNNPKMKKETVQKILDSFNVNFNESAGKESNNLVLLLTLELFTKEEIVVSNQFYETEIGKTILKKSYILLDKFLPPFEKLVEKNTLTAMEKTTVEMKKIGIRFKQ